MTPDAKRQLEIDPAWLAGFFDGDGTAGIYRRKATDKRHEEWFVMAGFGQHSKAILEEIKSVYGGHLYHRGSTNNRGMYGSVWQLSWTHAKAETLLRDIFPHLRIKKAEVAICLRFRDAKNKPGKPGADRGMYAEFAEQLKAIRNER